MDLPDTLEEVLAPEWLTAALGVPVTDVQPGPIDERISTNQPARVAFADGTWRDIWIKGYFSEVGRSYRMAGVPETMFYRDLMASTGVRTLRPLLAEADVATGANVLVTEDVVGRGAVFLNALSPYTVDQAAQSLEQLAHLHAATWMRAECLAAPWLAPRFVSYAGSRGVPEISFNFDGPIGRGVPDAVRDPQRLFDAYRKMASSLAEDTPWAVIHGDPHIGNVYLDGARRPCLLDWQLVQRGPWYVDVGYHLASALSVEDRRRSGTDLVRHYLETLGRLGAPAPSEAAAWTRLQRGFLHGFYLWAITMKVDTRITAALLTRLGTAVEDHRALAEWD